MQIGCRSLVILSRSSNSPIILEKAVGTTDFADDADEEAIALERAFTRRVSAEEAFAFRDSGYHPCDPCDPWFLNCRI